MTALNLTHMPESKQEQEFKVFGIFGKLRTGLVLGFLTLSLTANVTLFYSLQRSKDDNIKIQQEATKQVIEILRPDINQMAEKVNASSVKIDSAVNGIQSITENHKK